MIGKGATISTLDLPRLVVPLEGVPGKMVIHLALQEAQAKGANAALLAVPPAPTI